MLAKTRQDYIQKALRAHGAVTVAELVEQFGVSAETVRRDLLAMEQAGVLHRVHGGAMTANAMMPYRSLENRLKDRNDQKDALCRAAAETVEDGDYIAIGTGSTPVHFARILVKKVSKLTVVTYSLQVLQTLRENPGIEILLVGGRFDPDEETFSGQLALDMLQRLHVEKSYVFPSAVSLEHGICSYEETLYPQQRALLHNCDQAYILADSSKFERKALYKVDDMRKEYIYITDSQLPCQLRSIYEENGIQVITGE